MCIHISKVAQESASLKASIYQACGQTFEAFTALGDPAGGETITPRDDYCYYERLKYEIVKVLGRTASTEDTLSDAMEEQPRG